MENKKSYEMLLWLMLILHLVLISLGAFAKIMHWPHWQPLMLIGFLFFALSWLLVFSEIYQNTIYKRSMWLVFMFFLPTISPAVYLIRRRKLRNAITPGMDPEKSAYL